MLKLKETIYNSYKEIVEAIQKLQNLSLLSVESLQIMDDEHTSLYVLYEAKNEVS